MANLLHSKGSRTQIYKTLPSNDVGNDGDIILSQIQGRGVYLCSKVNGKWHVSSKMEELRKIEKTSTKDLRTNKLRVLDDLSIGRGTTQITKDEAKFSSSLKIKEAANAISNTTAYGQLWVKTATPNELYFTTDAGNDIQLTSGTTAAFVGDITSVVAGDGLTGGGASSDVTLNVNVDDSTIETNSDALRIKDSGVTYAKIQNMTNARMLGNNSGGAAAPSEMTQANVLSFLGVEAGATADQTQSDINGLAITTVGTIDTGTWEGTTIAVDQGGTGATNSNAWLNSRITTNADGSLNYDATGATAVNHDSLAGFVSNEHIDWTASSAGTIHSSNYTNTTYSVMASGNSYAAGLVAAGSGTHSNQFLRKDGTWVVPENDNTNQLTTFTVSATTDSNATTISQGDDLMFAAGTGITCETTADGTVTISSTVTDTNTTYSAGALLDLSTTTFNVDLTELTDGTADVVGSADELVYLDDGVQKRKQIDEIKLGQFNNDQGWTSNTGDIDRVKFTTDSGNHSITTGNADWTISGGEGINTSASSSTITIAAEEASSVNKGVAAFSTDNFLVSSGNVTIKDLGVATDELDNRAVTYAKMQNVTDARMLGNNSGSAASPTEMTKSDVLSFLNVADGANANVSGDSGNAAIYDDSGTPALKSGITANEVIDLLGVLKNGDVGGNDTFTGTLTIDRNKAPAGTTSNYDGLLVDYDRTNTPSSGTDLNTGINIDMDLAGATGSGSQKAAGIASTVTFSAHAGTLVEGRAATLSCYGADAGSNIGLSIQTEGVGPDIKIVSDGQPNDYFTISTIEDGETTFTTVEDGGGSTAHMNFIPDGDFKVDATGDVTLDAGGNDIFFKLNGATFAQMGMQEFHIYNMLDTPDDYFKIGMGNNGETTLVTYDDNAANGHLNIEPDGHVEFDGCGVGFDLVTPTFNAADTNVDFKTGNKQMVTLTDNLLDLNLTFPATSGNFTILLKQDGTGSRTMAADGWLAFESDGTAATVPAVKFPGGTAPTLTTAANHVDIISFFWDADNQVCYGVASLDFQD